MPEDLVYHRAMLRFKRPQKKQTRMSIVEVKILAALAILAMGILGGIVPLAAARHGTGRRLLSFGNALAGGIFLGAGFIHLLPEAGEALKEVVDYPLAPLVAALGIGLLLLIDRVVFEFIRSEQTRANKGRPSADISTRVIGSTVRSFDHCRHCSWSSTRTGAFGARHDRYPLPQGFGGVCPDR